MLNKNFGPIIIPFISFFILVIGLSIQNTLIPIRLENSGFSIFNIGIVYSCYYMGMLISSFKTDKYIYKLGFLRSYIYSVIIFAITAILHILSDNIYFLSFLRMATGFSIASLFIILESWRLAVCKYNYRGKVMALYNIGYYGSYAFGQYLLNFTDYKSNYNFLVIFIIGISSIIPFTNNNQNLKNPTEHKTVSLLYLLKIAPLAAIVSIIAGFDTSVIYSLVPVYLNGYITTEYIGSIMSLTLLSAMIIQYPIGKLSDVVDRKIIIITLSIIQLIISLLLYLNISSNIIYVTILLMILGGVTYTFYPLGINILCDSVKPTYIVAATQLYVLVNIIGAIFGPIIAPIFVHSKNQNGIFLYLSLCSMLIIPSTVNILVSKLNKFINNKSYLSKI